MDSIQFVSFGLVARLDVPVRSLELLQCTAPHGDDGGFSDWAVGAIADDAIGIVHMKSDVVQLAVAPNRVDDAIDDGGERLVHVLLYLCFVELLQGVSDFLVPFEISQETPPLSPRLVIVTVTTTTALTTGAIHPQECFRPCLRVELAPVFLDRRDYS